MPFKRDAEESISQLRVTGEQSQSKLRQLDLKLTKMDMLPDKVEILESQFGRLNKGIKNIESGMSADNPLAGEVEGLSARPSSRDVATCLVGRREAPGRRGSQ